MQGIATAQSPFAALRPAEGETIYRHQHKTRRAVILPKAATEELLDEGIGADESAPSALLDRLALLAQIDDRFDRDDLPFDCETIESARERLPHIRADDRMTRALAEAAAVFGVESSRALIFALRVARIHAALSGHTTIAPDDAAVAARLVLAPRATILPAAQQEEEARRGKNR